MDSTGRTDRPSCPQCGAQVFPSDAVCLDCGLNLRTGVVTAGTTDGERAVTWLLDAARTALDDGDAPLAIQRLRRVLTAEPQNTSARWWYAHALEHAGMHGEALAEWRNLYPLLPDEQVRERLVACGITVASGYEQSNRWAESVQLYDALLQDFPGQSDLVSSRASAVERRADYEEAVARQQQANAGTARATATGAAAGGTLGTVAGAGVGVGAFGGGMVTMLLGTFLLLVGIFSIPCCVGILIIPFALTTIASGLAMVAGAPLAAVGTGVAGALGGAATGAAAGGRQSGAGMGAGMAANVRGGLAVIADGWRRGGASRTAIIIVGALALVLVLVPTIAALVGGAALVGSATHAH